MERPFAVRELFDILHIVGAHIDASAIPVEFKVMPGLLTRTPIMGPGNFRPLFANLSARTPYLFLWQPHRTTESIYCKAL
jgi:hypothetical protein